MFRLLVAIAPFIAIVVGAYVWNVYATLRGYARENEELRADLQEARERLLNGAGVVCEQERDIAAMVELLTRFARRIHDDNFARRN